MLKVYGIARLTRDPEIKGNSNNIVKFGVATNNYKDEPQYFDVTAFTMGKYDLPAIISNNFKKGDAIFLKDAELEYHSWEDNEGNKRHSVGIILKQFEFVGGKKSDEDGVPF
jgi:single-stranded DNA-binding protein